MTLSVFISHANKDWNRVERFGSWLYGIGIKPLLAILEYDAQYVEYKVRSLIDQSDLVIVFWTENAKDSEFVNQEIGYAHGKKPIVIIRDRGISMSGFIYGMDTIDLGAGNPEQEVIKLKDYLEGMKAQRDVLDFLGALGFGLLLGGGLALLLLGRK